MQKKHTFLCLTLVCLFSAFSVSAQQTIGLFNNSSKSAPGYVLFSPNGYPAHYLIDKCGKLVNKWTVKNTPGLDAFLLPNGNLLSTGNLNNPVFAGTGPGSAGGLIELYSWDNKLLWSYTLSDSMEVQNHDVYPMPNGNILVAIWERHTDKEALALGRDSATGEGEWCAKVEEIEPVGTDSAKIVWQWRLWDHLVQDRDSTKPNYGKIADHPERLNINYTGVGIGASKADWIHLNSITYNPDLDQVMISCRELCEIYVIDHSTTTAQAATNKGGMHGKGGDILYRWGNPAAYNRGTHANEKLFVQHDATWIPKGYPDENKIMIFNDGLGRPAGNYSSVEVISPPIDANGNYQIGTGVAYGPDSSYWNYKAPNPTDFFSIIEGSAQRLLNGHTLICESTKGNFFEIDSSKNIVWHYVSPVAALTGPLAQGTKPPVLGQGVLSNIVFRGLLYDTGYAAFRGKTLVSGLPIESNPLSYSCTTAAIEKSVRLGTLNLKVVNPFSDMLTVSADLNIENANVRIFDMTGKCIWQWKNINIPGKFPVQLYVPSTIKHGIYFLQVENAEGVFSEKVVHI